jgi:hypothetical protein
VTDQMEQLRRCARLELPEQLWLIAATMPDEAWDRLDDLMRRWPAERGWPPPWAEVRRCLHSGGGVSP